MNSVIMPPGDGSRRAEIADLGRVLGPSLPNMNPEAWGQHELFAIYEGKIWLKYDEICFFYAPAAGGMVVSYSVAGKQVYWEPCPIPGFKGELLMSNVRGWLQIGLK